MTTSNSCWLAATLFIAVTTVPVFAAVDAGDSCGCPCDATPCGDKLIDPRGSMSHLLEQAPTVFVGVVVRAETVACCDRVADVTFRITKGYKAMALDHVTLRTGAGCGRPFPFAIGRQYLVAARWQGQPSQLETYCGFQPLEAESARAQIQELDALQRTMARPDEAK